MVGIEIDVSVGVGWLPIHRCPEMVSFPPYRKGSWFSFSSSMVNWDWWVCSFRCWWNLSSAVLPCGQMTKVSSTYLIHVLGFMVMVLSPTDSFTLFPCGKYSLFSSGSRLVCVVPAYMSSLCCSTAILLSLSSHLVSSSLSWTYSHYLRGQFCTCAHWLRKVYD